VKKSPDKVPDNTETVVSVAGHPLHPMLVTFPIAFLLGAFASDVVFLYEGDPFWARMSFWLIGAGTFMGFIAGMTGAVELLSVRGIRRRPAAWHHFVASVMLLSVAVANWLWRLDDPAAAILPWGIALSFMTVLLVSFAGWLGGTLVFEHRIGIEQDD
jgi:uncharacterized membrane protein